MSRGYVAAFALSNRKRHVLALTTRSCCSMLGWMAQSKGAKRLLQYAVLHKLTMQALAELFEIGSRGTVCNWCTGARVPKRSNARLIEQRTSGFVRAAHWDAE